MKLDDTFNNREYRRPTWQADAYIRYHNGRYYTPLGSEIHPTCIQALMEFTDWELYHGYQRHDECSDSS